MTSAVRARAHILSRAGTTNWFSIFAPVLCHAVRRACGCRYVAYKHHQLLFLDIMGGVYQLGIAAALTKRALWQHPATWVLLLMTLIKALPHVPLLLGYKQQHIRCAAALAQTHPMRC